MNNGVVVVFQVSPWSVPINSVYADYGAAIVDVRRLIASRPVHADARYRFFEDDELVLEIWYEAGAWRDRGRYA